MYIYIYIYIYMYIQRRGPDGRSAPRESTRSGLPDRDIFNTTTIYIYIYVISLSLSLLHPGGTSPLSAKIGLDRASELPDSCLHVTGSVQEAGKGGCAKGGTTVVACGELSKRSTCQKRRVGTANPRLVDFPLSGAIHTVRTRIGSDRTPQIVELLPSWV